MPAAPPLPPLPDPAPPRALWVRPGQPEARPWPDELLPAAMRRHAAGWIRARADYAPTPLRALAGLAAVAGVAEAWVKDESARFGRGGVKALGAPYGLACRLAACGGPAGRITALAATDGNHGLALAWAAGEAGCRARLFVGSSAEPRRIAAIRAAGADVCVVPGTYDDAVAAAEQAAREAGTVLISDTDPRGDLPVAQEILAGYALLGEEIAMAGDPARYTHVFLQCGVGGVAAGLSAGLWAATGLAPPVVCVEPERAACLLASLRAGAPACVPGDLATRMVGLSCGYPSLPAWRVLSATARAALTVDEATAAAAQAWLGAGIAGDPPLDAGDTGIAGIAGFLAAARDPATRARLGLRPDSRVLLLSSEGALR